jgi:WD40 repeat protein
LVTRPAEIDGVDRHSGYEKERALAWSPDGRNLAFAAGDGGSVWKVDLVAGSFAPRMKAKAESPLECLAWWSAAGESRGDGKSRAAGKQYVVRKGGGVDAYDAAASELMSQTAEPFQPQSGTDSRISLSPDGASAAQISQREGEVRIFATDPVSQRCTIDAANVSALHWSGDGQRIATISAMTQVWNTRSGALVNTIDVARPMALSPDGHELVCTAAEGPLAEICDVESGHIVRKFAAAPTPARDGEYAWSPDGRCIARGGAVWDARSGDTRDFSWVGLVLLDPLAEKD